MGTELVTHKSQEVVGKRYWGGNVKGTTLALYLTKAEYENYKNVLVGYECTDVYQTLEQLVNDWVSTGKTLEYETAQSLNDTARELENHRWVNDKTVGDWLQEQANECRVRAKQATKDSVRVV